MSKEHRRCRPRRDCRSLPGHFAQSRHSIDNFSTGCQRIYRGALAAKRVTAQAIVPELQPKVSALAAVRCTFGRVQRGHPADQVADIPSVVDEAAHIVACQRRTNMSNSCPRSLSSFPWCSSHLPSPPLSSSPSPPPIPPLSIPFEFRQAGPFSVERLTMDLPFVHWFACDENQTYTRVHSEGGREETNLQVAAAVGRSRASCGR